MVDWGRLRLGHVIGSGASGVCYQGTFAGTAVAIKVLHPQSVTEADLAALVNECRLMLKLRHPHVLMTIGFASDGGKSGTVSRYTTYVPPPPVPHDTGASQETVTPVAPHASLSAAVCAPANDGAVPQPPQAP